MSATITAHTDHSITLEVTIELLPSMLESERSIQVALNEAGCLATGSALERFDTDGSALVMGTSRWTSKGLEAKAYQTPYGEQIVSRHVYQTSSGGRHTVRWNGTRASWSPRRRCSLNKLPISLPR